jgi:hypothetical protein
MAWSSHIAYFDESGDHGLQKIDQDFPVFVLCGCIFKKEDYLKNDLQSFSSIKFKHFGHDAVVFHSQEIRKRVGYFQILAKKETREAFTSDISDFFKKSSSTLVAAAIRKGLHKNQYAYPEDPYAISLMFCLERLYGFLKDKGDTDGTTVCVFEERGKTEDYTLAAHFEEICAGANQWGQLPFRMVFANKKTNMPGLQIADLAAYPIARHVIDEKKLNPAFDAIEPRFRRSPNGKVIGWGLKIFP